MIEMRKIKSKVVPYVLLGTMGLTLVGCSNEEKKTVSKVNSITSESTFQTTQTTQELTEEQVTNEIENKEEYYYALAAESYNNYTKFYSNSKMAYADENANCGINIDRIENVIKVINGEVSNLTPSQISDAKEDIGYILLSQKLVSNLDDIIAQNLGYITINGQMNIEDIPKLSIYAKDEETKEVVENYESLRDQVINDINTTNNVSLETKENLKNAVIQMEKEYLPDETNMNNDVTAEGNKLLENLAKEQLCELTVLATNEARIETDEFPGGLKLAAETDEEKDILNRYNLAVLGLNTEIVDFEKALDIKSSLVVTKYEEGACAHEEILARHAKDNTDVYSKEELQNIKSYLEALKSNKYTHTLSM